MSDQPRVFISHSSKDKPFVRRLADDLKGAELGVWFDERELGVGDSIVEGISDGLKDTDYLIAVLSPNSIDSKWVKAELNSALMDQLSDGGTVVLPALIEDCEIPTLLQDRIYADFRKSYEDGLDALLFVLKDESDHVQQFVKAAAANTCQDKLSGLSLADLRRRMKDKLSQDEVADAWVDTFEYDIDDDLPGKSKAERVRKAIDKAKREGKMDELIDNLCKNSGHVANP